MRKKSIQTADLLQTALNVFARYGYTKTTLADIAGELHMTKANLYNYVDSKEHLYHQAVSYALDNWNKEVGKKIERCDRPVEQFKVMVREAFRYIEQNDELQQLLMHDRRILSISTETDMFAEVNMKARGMLNNVLEEGMERGMFYEVDTELMTEYMFSTYMMFLMKKYVFKEGKKDTKVFEQALEIITRGLIRPEYLAEVSESS